MSLPPSSASLSPPSTLCRIRFGVARTSVPPSPAALAIALPVLAGPDSELLLERAESSPSAEGFELFRAGDELAGFAIGGSGEELTAAAAELYGRLFRVTAGLHLYRIWNYVPRINSVVEGLENYRRFCRGRSLAFEQHFGPDFPPRLPAASGVGTPEGPLALAFVAGPAEPRHCENPQQIPAFRYPAQYGPRPPSFSRATVIPPGRAPGRIYISGTAAIRGHATVAPHDLHGQLDCTVANLRAISMAAGAGADCGGAHASRHFKVYLRHATDWPEVQAHLQRTLLRADDVVTALRADLCRSDLLIEIEATLNL